MRKLFMSGLIVLGIIFYISNLSYGVPAAPVIHTLVQADGSTFEGRQWGDESYHGWETLDGYTIVFDESLENWAYAIPGNEGGFVSSAQVVGKDSPPVGVPLRLRPTSEFLRTGSWKVMGLSWETSGEPYRVVPSTGTANVPVVLANFSDTSTTYTSTNFNTLLFGTGNFSMKDYYQEVSYGKFTVAAGPGGVVGWYKGSKTREYYGKDTDPNDKGSDACPGDLVYEAAAAADAAGFNFAPYDNNGDCYVDILVVVHQGRGQDESADTNDIWSHRWNLNSAKNASCSINQGEYTTKSNCTKGGKIKVNDYFLTPETNSSGMTAMGVYAHEFGHALGLPDLYDTDGSSNGIGYWSLMASGSWNMVTVGGDRPAHPDAWTKYKLGWVTPTLITGTLSNEAVTQAATAADVYQCPTGSPSAGGEYFLVENRQKAGFDVGLPGAGLLIYHIDESKTTNKEECYPGGPSCSTQHYKVAIEQADGQWHLEKKTNKGDAQDPYTSPKEFTDTTSPGSKFYSDTSSNFSVTAISASGSTMTATMSCGGTPPPSCPRLYFWNGNEFELATTIFPGTVVPEAEYTDYILLKNLVPVKGMYVFEIRETESENSFIDKAKLILVDRGSEFDLEEIFTERSPDSHAYSNIWYNSAGTLSDVLTKRFNNWALSLLVAEHSDSALGDVRHQLGSSDNWYVPMKTGDILTLKFQALPFMDIKRDFIFIVEGYYIPLVNNENIR